MYIHTYLSMYLCMLNAFSRIPELCQGYYVRMYIRACSENTIQYGLDELHMYKIPQLYS